MAEPVISAWPHVREMREAATLMRQRAEAATPGPWTAAHNRCVEAPRRRVVASVGAREEWPTAADAKHIASWHPEVAEWIAALLVAAAQREDEYLASYPPGEGDDNTPVPGDEAFYAWCIARAFLGRPAPLGEEVGNG